MFRTTWHESHQQHEQPPWEGIADAVQQSHGRLPALLGDLDGRKEDKVIIIDYAVCFISCVRLHYPLLYRLKLKLRLIQSWNRHLLCYFSSDYVHVLWPQLKFPRYLSAVTLKFPLEDSVAFPATSSHPSVSRHSQNDYSSLWHQWKGVRNKRENINHPWKHHM